MCIRSKQDARMCVCLMSVCFRQICCIEIPLSKVKHLVAAVHQNHQVSKLSKQFYGKS